MSSRNRMRVWEYRRKLKGTCSHISECAYGNLSCARLCTLLHDTAHTSECACAHILECACRRKCKATHRWCIAFNAYCFNIRPQYINNDASRSKLSRYCSANTKMKYSLDCPSECDVMDSPDKWVIDCTSRRIWRVYDFTLYISRISGYPGGLPLPLPKQRPSRAPSPSIVTKTRPPSRPIETHTRALLPMSMCQSRHPPQPSVCHTRPPPRWLESKSAMLPCPSDRQMETRKVAQGKKGIAR